MSENKAEPLAKTRTRRSNAGARMHEMMFAAEDDELFAQTYGGLLKADEDSSEDEEYIPKDLDTAEGDIELDDDDAEGNNDDDHDGSSSDGSSDDDSQEDSDDESDVDGEEKEESTALDGGEDKSGSHQNHDTKQYKSNHVGIKCESTTGKTVSQIQPGSPSKAAYDSCAKICCVCLGDQADSDDDEVIECDSCGVTVHESCYGVAEGSDNNSIQSNISSESTLPWFCEPCMRAVRNPYCELCPNTGGIFKQTDTGRWVHMVCALYTRGVTFENIDTLSTVSLLELNPALFGSKACNICEDRRLARSGVCIGCDAGMCKIFFHATCAQKEGLLFDSHSDEVDPYFAQCKQHADKTIIRRKKRICTALLARLKRVQPLESCSERTKTKLGEITREPNLNLTRWSPDNPPPIPQKVGRMLMTCPSLIIKLTKKSELMGLDPQSTFMNVHDEMEMARQKWHIPPAFNLEFVAYCRDRTTRMVQMKKNNTELVYQNTALKSQEAELRERYNSIKELVADMRHDIDALVKEARALQKSVAAVTGKHFDLPLQIQQLICQSTYSKDKGSSRTLKATNKTSSTYSCGKCETVKDQHLLALCDTCNAYFHIYCLDPPLTRVPKKTKFGGWQCSDCSEKDEEDQEDAIEEQNTIAIQEMDGPRRLRERIKYPEKYCQESLMLADFWTTSRKKTKRSSKSTKIKKPKVEP